MNENLPVVETDEMPAEPLVVQLVLRVQHEEYEVESRHESVRELNVLHDGLLGVPGRLDGVGGRQDGGPRVQLADDARLGDGQGLLLHDLWRFSMPHCIIAQWVPGGRG